MHGLMRSRAACSLAAAGAVLALWLPGCDEPLRQAPDSSASTPQQAPVWESLADWLPFAGASGRGAPPEKGEDGAILQAPGTTIRWHFVVPREARLAGRVGVSGPGAPSGDTAFRIEIEDTQGRHETVFEGDLSQAEDAPGGEIPVDVDLSPWAEGMVRIETRVPEAHAGTRADSTPGGWRLAWRDLAIRAPGAPASPDSAHAQALAHPGTNLLIVLFDTLRADHTQPYGSPKVKTPQLLALAARGVTFTDASANASWTAPSVTSLLTSTHPTVHGVSGAAAFDKLSAVSMVPPGLPLLPEVLQQHGYATQAIFNNPIISPSFGYERGFDEVDEYFHLREQVLKESPSPAEQVERVWERDFEPLLARRGERPFFVFLHEIDPHHPYQAPEPWVRMYLKERREPAADLAGSGLAVHDWFLHDPGRLSPRLVREIQGLYDAEVSFMDAYLGELVAKLEAAGLREDTLIVFLSDHGESLAEHGLLGHGKTLYEEVLEVPLLMSLPGVLPEGLRVTDPVALVDVAPTVLGLLGVPAPAGMQGRSLVPLLGPHPPPPAPRARFARSRFEGRWNLDSVRVADWKLIRRARDGGRDWELYDLAHDPREARNRWSEEPIVGGTLRQLLLAKMVRDAERREQVAPVAVDRLDPGVRQQLRALGYAE